ncbi:hypothetical protein BDV93DRAFT_519268 [Ceratobasidium sp. AG-I]|nr:hypothetical protein BDV93DRAFT_519268 [Ceratobasidium sp. AG-I]
MSSYAQSTTSSASLVSHQQPRDYSAAFGALASSYGASGSAPCRASSKTASHLATTESSSKRFRSFFSRRSSSSTPSNTNASHSEKYVVPKSQDFGALMDKYGASMAVGAGNGVL